MDTNAHHISRRQFIGTTLAASAAAVLATRTATAQNAAAAAPDTGWQIGCYTRPWTAFEYRVALDAIAEAGFKYAGLMTAKSDTGLVISVKTTPEEAQQVGEECKKRGLIVPSIYGGDIPVATSLEAGIEGLKRLIDHCAAIGAANLMMGGVGDQNLYDAYFKAIAECCPYAESKGVGISMKPHGGLNATGPQCKASLEKVGHKNFRIWYDPGNIFYYSDAKLNPVDDAPSVDGLVIGMSVKDFALPKEVMLTPGTGMVDFPAVMAKLKQGGFTKGPLVIECLTIGELPKILEEAKKAKAFVENLVK